MHGLALLKFLAKRPQPQHQNIAGFTLIEVLTVIVMVGILGAIAAPSWLGFVARQRLNATQNNVFDAFRRTQSNAKRDKIPWQITFRYNNSASVSQWAVHPASNLPSNIGLIKTSDLDKLSWQNFEPGIMIQSTTFDDGKSLEKTYRITRTVFNSKGQPSSGLTSKGKITMSPTKSDGTIAPNSAKSCVILSTLLGAVKTAQDTDCD